MMRNILKRMQKQFSDFFFFFFNLIFFVKTKFPFQVPENLINPKTSGAWGRSPSGMPNWFKICAMFWNQCKNNFPMFAFFLFFEILSLLYSKLLENLPKYHSLILDFFSFESSEMYAKNFIKIVGKSTLQKKYFNKVFVLCGLRPQGPNAFGLNTSSQLVIGYHWLVFLNLSRKNIQVSET